MEIGLMTPREWPWVLARAVKTGVAQVPPALRSATRPERVAHQIETLLPQVLSQPGSAALVAREGQQPVGYIVVTVIPDDLTGQPLGLFWDIWVEPPWRGTGVSSRLTAAGEAHLKALGLKAVRRAISSHNTASLRHALSDGCHIDRISLLKVLS
ncbi:MAG TPA: GNAT family N-acetyltransferase [Symbiobacteriaceae bacterium]